MKFPQVNLEGIPAAEELLKGARERLDIYNPDLERKDIYVCNAMARFYKESPEESLIEQGIRLKGRIADAIYPFIFVTSWADMIGATSQDKLDYRHAWIDHMLNQIKGE